MSDLAPTLSESEKAVRLRFVEQYLKDYDALAAAVRLGYESTYAETYAGKFMKEPFTLQAISEQEGELGITTEEDKHRKRIVAGLYRIAHSRHSPASSQVAAFTQVAKIVGIEAPVKTVQDVRVTSNSPDMAHLGVADLEFIKEKLYNKTPVTPELPAPDDKPAE